MSQRKVQAVYYCFDAFCESLDGRCHSCRQLSLWRCGRSSLSWHSWPLTWIIAVSFTVLSMTPYPFMVCHCNADTKCAGTCAIRFQSKSYYLGFFNCNIMGEAKTLKVTGSEHTRVLISLVIPPQQNSASEDSLDSDIPSEEISP